nr:MAG TPA: Cro/C1-type HTH DNA-binding domain protein [Caudoviricetes sp.]
MYIRLKQFLIEKNIKNKEVACKLGISEGNFSRKINNRKGADFNLTQVRDICKMYNLDPNIYFFSNSSCLNDNKKPK